MKQGLYSILLVAASAFGYCEVLAQEDIKLKVYLLQRAQRTQDLEVLTLRLFSMTM